MRAALILAFGFRLALAPEVAAATHSNPGVHLPDYSGSWKLNRELSDDPAQALKDWRGSGGGSGSSGGWHGRGGRGRHGGGGGSGDSPGESGSGESPSSAFAALDTLTIRHQEPAITIVDGVGREHRLTTDGKKVEEERSHGGTTKVSAAWKDGHLEIVSVPERGPRWTETYSITADRTQLTVTTKIDGSRGGTATIRRVYDAAPADEAPQEPPQRPADDSPAVQDETVQAR
jgi:hypothetical protein